MCVCERERERERNWKSEKFVHFQNLFALIIFQFCTVNRLTNVFHFCKLCKNQTAFLFLNRLKTLILFLSVHKNQLILTQSKYFQIFFAKMPKLFSTRGRLAMEAKLAAQEARTGVFHIQASSVLHKLQTICAERGAVEAGFLSLSLQRQTELEKTMSDGSLRHDKLCRLLTGQLGVVGNLLAACFEEYLHTYRRLFGGKPTYDDVSETMWVLTAVFSVQLNMNQFFCYSQNFLITKCILTKTIFSS